MAKQIDFTNLTYYFKGLNLASINFTGFRGLMHIYNEIKNGNMSIEKIEEDQKQFKSDLNEITRGNTKKKSAYQIKTIEYIKNLYDSRQKKKTIYLMIMLKLYLKLCTKQNKEQDLKC